MKPLFRLGVFALVFVPSSALGQMYIAPLKPPSPALAAQNILEIYEPGRSGVSTPELLKEVKPDYTPQGRAAKIEGMVTMLAVVLADGTVGTVKVLRSLDSKHGLDAQAIKAAKGWTFKPALKDGKPVATRVTIEMMFTLKG